ncbi:hypothetical protein ABZ260_28625 [Streptosporangium sp. NPDC006013]|uniref:hypothetical protein n=1 Tax=Streptosporangium sp. NPDC006013 TaxID=3155596 RepID=UPI0033BB0133
MSNPSGLSMPWVFKEESIVDAALLFKHCRRIPYAQVLLHVLADHPDQIYSLTKLAQEAEANTDGIAEAIRGIDQACDAYGRVSLVKKMNDEYQMSEEVANVLKAAWENWSS